MVLAPDELVDYLVECLAYNGDQGASLAELWSFASENHPSLDNFMKQIIWKWLVGIPDLVIVGHDMANPLPTDELDLGPIVLEHKHANALRVYATEENQWLKLTGMPKEGNPIGSFPFKLLCAVSRSRSRGITSVQIARETGQDSRSIHGRVSLLMDHGLVQRYPVIVEGMSTHLTVFKKFITSETSSTTPSDMGLDPVKLRKSIVEAVQSAQNGLRQYDDLKMELGFDKHKRAQVAFATAVRNLDSQGYIKRVRVVRANTEDRKQQSEFRCIKFVKPLPDADDKNQDSDFSDIEFDEIDEGLDNDYASTSSPTKSNGTKTTASIDPSILSVDELKIEDEAPASQESDKCILFNQFFPLENQIYDVVNEAGISGIPVMELCRNLVGANYSRNFSRLLEFLAGKPPARKSATPKGSNQIPANLQHLAIIRGIDFSARVKFYRYFSQPAYCAFISKPFADEWGDFQPVSFTGASKTLNALDKKHNIALPGLLEVVAGEDGVNIPLFHGEKGKMAPESVVVVASAKPAATSTGKRRGRPRKRPLSDDEAPPPPVRRPSPPEPPSPPAVVELPPVAVITRVNDPSTSEDVTMTDTDSVDVSMVSSSTMSVDAAPSKDTTAPQLPASSSYQPSFGSSDGSRRLAQLASFGNTPAMGRLRSTRESKDVSFATLKRQGQILSLLRESGGVMEGAQSLMRLLAERYPQLDGSVIDRKTVERCVTSLVNSQQAIKVHVTVPSVRGIHITKYMLLDPSTDPDSPLVEEIKQQMIEGVKRKPTPTGPVTVEEGDFQYYFKDNANVRAETVRRLAREGDESPKTPKRARKSTDTPKSRGSSRKVKVEQPKVPRHSRTQTPETSSPALRSSPVVRRQKTTNGAAPPAKAEPQRDPITGRLRRPRRFVGSIDTDKFYRIVIITRSFYGTQGIINWEKVVEALPDFTVDLARMKWHKIRDIYGGTRQMSRAAQRWQALFLKSYENGDLPLVEDGQFDVGFYADFWKSREGELEQTGSSWLYKSRTDVEAEYDVVKVQDEEDPLECVYSSRSMVKIDEILTEVPFGYTEENETEIEDELTSPVNRAKQVVKGVIATSEDIYDIDKADHILTALGHAAVKAVELLEHEKAIVYIPRDKTKVIPGRNYLFSERFNSTVQLRMGQNVFEDATQFEDSLLSAMDSSRGMIMSRVAPDSSLLCILDLISHRLVDLVRVNTTTGSLVTGYLSRAIDKGKLDCDIVLRSPASGPKPSPVARPDAPVTLGSECQYIWTSVKSTLNQDIWEKLVKRVLMLVALRPGIPSRGVQARLDIVLTLAETRQLLTWLCGRGCLRRGDHDGHYIQTQWYSRI